MTNQDPEPSRPSGTVYGRGGVDVREPRGGRSGSLHPAVTALAVIAGIVAVLALGYWTWRTPVDVPEHTTPAAAPPASSPAASAQAATPSPAPDRLSTGSWHITPADDPDTHLSAEGVFAAMSSGDPMVLTALPGLADNLCFSFRDENSKYLRHFDYRLRFDAEDDSELFRNDATFCPEDDQPAGTIRLSSKNYPDHLWHRRGTELYIDKPDGSDKFDTDSSFAVQPSNS